MFSNLYFFTSILILLFIIYYDILSIRTIVYHKIQYNLYQLHIIDIDSFIPKPSDIDLYNLLNSKTVLPNLKNLNIIPNRLFQTYYNKDKIPDYIFNNQKLYASNYEYTLFNDKEATNFLNKYFDNRILKRFNLMSKGAHKADLLRYCYLYIFGGIYLDIKIILIKQLDEIFKDKTVFYTCISYDDYTIHNAILASKPRNILFLKLIWYIVNVPLSYIDKHYLIFCRDLYMQIQNDLITKQKKLISGLHLGNSQNYYLFQEKVKSKLDSECKQLDRYGYCASIYDKDEKIFIGRDPNFPWK